MPTNVSTAPATETQKRLRGAPSDSAASTSGTASFVSVPPGATVFVDGKRVVTIESIGDDVVAFDKLASPRGGR